MDQGAVYCIGRAKEGLQPIIIINVKRFCALGITIEEQQQFAFAFFDWIVNNMMCPGHVESWFVVLDLKDVGITQLPA